MCGIVGAFGFAGLEGDGEVARRESMVKLFTEILQVTHKRGEDATGVSALFDNGDFMIQKHGVSSLEFITKFGGTTKDYEGFLKLCRSNKSRLNIMIGHCRKSSVGNTWDNENNHPVRAGEIVGIHNGTLKNHNKIFEKTGLQRDGVVDSEAIMRLLQAYTNNGKDPFTTEALKETITRLEGTYSCLAYNVNNPYQVAAFRDGRPMEFALIKPLKIMLVASEKVFLEQAFFVYNKIAKLYNLGDSVIKKDDVHFDVLPNDEVAVIDLTRPVNDKTICDDLLDRENTRPITRIWKTAYTTYSGNEYSGNNRPTGFHGNQTSHKATNSNLPATTKKEEDTVKASNYFDGRIYCKGLQGYVSPEELEKSKKLGAVTIEEGGDITELDNKNKDVPVDTQTEETSEKKSEASTAKTQEVDVSLPPKVVEAATEATDALTRYSDDKDLLEDIDVVNESTIANVPKFAIANRVRKKVHESAFLDGARFYKNFQATSSTTVVKREGNPSAERAVRIAKHVVQILSNVMSKVDKSAKKSIKAANEVIEERALGELDTEAFRSVFKAGDMKRSSILSTLDTILGAADGQESNSD